jgi:His-Xaa-Ser system radical SAM maturase HxsC
MSPDTVELTITGGEPTLYHQELFDIIRTCRGHLPQTALHLLSNGRLFSYLSLAREIASIGHPDLMVGIPLYSDIPSIHEYVVQAQGAFDQTIRGILNLGRLGVPVEIRVVVHQQTWERLPHLARYITRNLPFVNHVTFMGLEMVGHTRMNLPDLWIDPVEYQQSLEETVRHLVTYGTMRVSVYNHQLCVLSPSLWPFARRSISDWKNEYLPLCDGCAVKEQCGGFFNSAISSRYSDHIKPLPSAALYS